jgi:hypothetical protein
MEKEMKDPADFYQEKDFPGRKLLAIAAGIWGIRWIAGQMINFEAIPNGINNLISLLLFIGLIIYFIGFWKAVKGKGYHPVLFLISFTAFIGLLVIFFLPNISENQSAQVNPCNPPENPRIT